MLALALLALCTAIVVVAILVRSISAAMNVAAYRDLFEPGEDAARENPNALDAPAPQFVSFHSTGVARG